MTDFFQNKFYSFDKTVTLHFFGILLFLPLFSIHLFDSARFDILHICTL